MPRMESCGGGRGRRIVMLLALGLLVGLVVVIANLGPGSKRRSLTAWAGTFCAAWHSLRVNSYRVEQLPTFLSNAGEAAQEKSTIVAALQRLRQTAQAGADARSPRSSLRRCSSMVGRVVMVRRACDG